MPVNPFALTEGVPTERVGDRLVEARRAAGMGRWRASRVAEVSRSNLVRMERGRMRPPDGTVIALCRTYDVGVSWLVPERSGNEVVVGAGRIEVAGRARTLTGSDHAVEAVLGSYLAIVRELRGVAAGGVVSLRDEDLVALARSLGDTPSEIEARLVDLMKLSREEARAVRRELLKRRVAVPAAGLLLATAAVTGSLDAGSGGGADRAGGGTFAGVRAEHTVDHGVPGGGSGASLSLGTSNGTGGAEVAAPASHAGGSSAVTPNVSVDGAGDDVVIGDAVSFVRDTPPPSAPRVVVPLPSVTDTPAAGGSADAPDAADAPSAPSSDGTVVVTDPGTSGATDGTGTVDPGTVDPGTGTGTGTNGGAGSTNAHGNNDNADPNAADAGNNSVDNNAGGNSSDNTHGANDNASPNATDAGTNGNGSDTGTNAAGGNSSDNASSGGDAAGGSANTGGQNSGDQDTGNDNAHGGNPNASGNAPGGASNGGAGNESAGAASPTSNGNGASNAHARP